MSFAKPNTLLSKLLSKLNSFLTKISPKRIRTGMFTNDYIAYLVRTKPFDYTVRRRFNDFVWLRNTLTKMYPGFYIPPLPEKGVKRSFEEEYVNDRMKNLQIFLDQVSEHPEIKASIYLLSFLKCKSTEQFDKMKKEWSRHQTPVSEFSKKPVSEMKRMKLSDFLHADGEIRSQINPNLKMFTNCLELLQSKIRLHSVK